MSIESTLLAQALVRQAAQLRFMPCPKCGNHQPFILKRKIPDCESCGYKFNK